MLTDERLNYFEDMNSEDGVSINCNVIADLIAQAREANALRAQLAELLEVKQGGVPFRDDAVRRAVACAPGYVDLTDPNDPYPAELVGDMARAVVALDREIDNMGLYCIEEHYKYKQRRNEQFAAYEKQSAQLAEARQLLSLFGNQLAEMHKVVAAAMEFSDAYSHVGRVHGSPPLEASVHAYRLWLSQNPHANHVGTVTVQPDGAVKT